MGSAGAVCPWAGKVQVPRFIESCARTVASVATVRRIGMASSAVLGRVLVALLEDYDIYDETTLATLIVD